eukprot:6741217-Pyramimonas_sp.AAC.1
MLKSFRVKPNQRSERANPCFTMFAVTGFDFRARAGLTSGELHGRCLRGTQISPPQPPCRCHVFLPLCLLQSGRDSQS